MSEVRAWLLCRLTFLKSIAAQIYYPPGFTESIFAQACVLARTMGLHQRHAMSDGVSPEEAQERFKVFRSLYLRDKSFSISRGSICWLPSFDCSLSSDLGQMPFPDSTCTARIQLARLQEDIYRLFHSAESQRQSSPKHKNALARIEQGLEQWTNEHDIFSSPCTGGRDADLQLEFLAARISAFRGSSDPIHIRRALNDARASCLLLLISSGKQDQSILQRSDTIPTSKSLAKSLGKTTSSRSNKGKNSTKESSSNTARENASESVPILFHSLLDTFSVPAFFLLVKNVLWPLSPNDDSQAEEDINLLQKACACYKELDIRVQANNHTRKVGRAFERLLEVVNLIKNPICFPRKHLDTARAPVAKPQPHQTRKVSSTDHRPSPTSPTFRPHPHTPCLLCPGIASRPKTSLIAPPRRPVRLPPPLLTPMETDFFSQHFQQQSMSPNSKKRPRLGEPEVSMNDYSGSRLLSDFLAASPMMAFEVPSQEDMAAAVF